jgi:hypothetical protein
VSSSPYVSNGTQSCDDVAGMVVSHVNGKEFTPLSIDLGEYYSTTNTDQTIVFIGRKPGGATVNASFDLDLLADGPGGIDDFQNFTFPPEFSNIVQLEVPNTRWRFDNLTFSTVVPPELPADQRLGPAFSSATLLYSKAVTSNTLVIGPDYQFVSGFQPASPTNTKFLLPSSSALISSTISPHYDRADQALYFTTPNTYSVRKYKSGVTSDAADIHDPPAGMTVTTISKPRMLGTGLLFMGTNSSGDLYYIFQKKNGVTTALVSPQTPLPIGKSTSTPHYYPTNIATGSGSYAFDTSVDSSPTTWRLFASFNGGAIQQVVAENDYVAAGVRLIDFGAFDFTSVGELRMRAELSSGFAWLYFTSAGLVRIEEIFITVAPANAGKQVTGEIFRTTPGVTFLGNNDEIYRESGGSYFRVIGAGDKIGDETIQSLKYMAARETLPLRIIVEARYASSSSTARELELTLREPELLAPRFGATTIHPESGDLFIPLSHLTLGKEYWLRGSSNLTDWTDLWKIDQVVPLQHVVVPPALLSSPSFFRVEER